MQPTAPKPMFSSPRVALTRNTGQQLALASLIVAETVMVVGLKVVQGTRGVFIGWPTRRDPITKAYSDVVFPLSKMAREEASALILAEYQKLADAQQAARQLEAADSHLEAAYEERTELGD